MYIKFLCFNLFILTLIFTLSTTINANYKLTYPLYLDNYLPYIQMTLSVNSHRVNIYIDIVNSFSFMSANVYYFDESFSYQRLQETSTEFTYNNTQFVGYLSTEIFLKNNNLYNYCNFYLVHTDKFYPKEDPYSKCVLCLNRANKQTAFNILSALSTYSNKAYDAFIIDYAFEQIVHFGNESTLSYEYQKHYINAYSCSVVNINDMKWNCMLNKIGGVRVHKEVYFDLNEYFNYVPYRVMQKLITIVFGKEWDKYCKEGIGFELGVVYYECSIGNDVKEKYNNVYIDIVVESIKIRFWFQKLFGKNNEFIFASKRRGGNEEEEEEFVFGYLFFKYFATVFDYKNNSLRMYNEEVFSKYLNEEGISKGELKMNVMFICLGLLLTQIVYIIMLYKIKNNDLNKNIHNH